MLLASNNQNNAEMENVQNEASSSGTRTHAGQRGAAKWSTRDKLCLVNVVASLGHENWVEISQCMQTLCARDHEELQEESEEMDEDMFSKSNCALEYERMLGDPVLGLEMDTSNTSDSQLNLKSDRLIEIRIQELREAIQRGQEVGKLTRLKL